MRTKEEAEAKGQELLAKMRGEGWQLQVWENLGWHYSVVNDPLAVYPSSGGNYHCLMSGGDHVGSGLGIWSTRGDHYNDPNDAVAAQIAEAEKVVNRLTEALRRAKIGAGLENSIGRQLADLGAKMFWQNKLDALYSRHDPDGCGCREAGNASFMCIEHAAEAFEIERRLKEVR